MRIMSFLVFAAALAGTAAQAQESSGTELRGRWLPPMGSIAVEVDGGGVRRFAIDLSPWRPGFNPFFSVNAERTRVHAGSYSMCPRGLGRLAEDYTMVAALDEESGLATAEGPGKVLPGAGKYIKVTFPAGKTRVAGSCSGADKLDEVILELDPGLRLSVEPTTAPLIKPRPKSRRSR
jgi:hypothetical protein